MKDYPLYEATYFNDFREMIENVAKKYPDRTAFSCKEDPHAEGVLKFTFEEVKNYARDYGTAMIADGARGKQCAIIGGTSIGWIYTFFTVMASGGISVPCDKELSVEDLCGIVEKAECKFVFYGSDVQEKIGKWMRVAAGVAFSRSLKIMRFGDNMREVAVTEGDKVYDPSP